LPFSFRLEAAPAARMLSHTPLTLRGINLCLPWYPPSQSIQRLALSLIGPEKSFIEPVDTFFSPVLICMQQCAQTNTHKNMQ
jgi:hypothetical protein